MTNEMLRGLPAASHGTFVRADDDIFNARMGDTEACRLDSEFIRELFAQFRAVTVRRMFGGAGIFAEGLMFGLDFDGAIYLKVNATNVADFEREGCQPFVYIRAKSPGRVGRHSLSYWRMPERLYDDPEELALWADRAFAIAQRKRVAPRAPAKSGA
jgi:DNA transformation protein and related proteins